MHQKQDDNKVIGLRVKELRERIGMKQIPFAKSLGITQSAISLIEKGEGVSLETLSKMSKTYQVSLDWLTEGKGNLLVGNYEQTDNSATTAHEPGLTKQLYTPAKGNNIAFVPLVAYGGFIEGYANELYMDSLEHFSLPGIFGAHTAFEVSGSSMEPFAYHQETVIAKPEEKIEWMVKGRAYVIVSVRGIHVKFFDKIGKDDKVHFRSANKAAGKFEPMQMKEIKKIYQVVRVLEDPYKRGYLELTEE